MTFRNKLLYTAAVALATAAAMIVFGWGVGEPAPSQHTTAQQTEAPSLSFATDNRHQQFLRACSGMGEYTAETAPLVKLYCYGVLRGAYDTYGIAAVMHNVSDKTRLWCIQSASTAELMHNVFLWIDSNHELVDKLYEVVSAEEAAMATMVRAFATAYPCNTI